MRVHIQTPIYERGDKKYIDVRLSDIDATNARHLHDLTDTIKDTRTVFYDPLVDNVLTIKVPWRYNKIDYKHDGLYTIFDLVEGDAVDLVAIFKGLWWTDTSHGLSWVLQSMNTNAKRGKVFH